MFPPLLPPADHVSDPFRLRRAAQGWTPPVSLHRLWAQPRAAGEEAAGPVHQQGAGTFPRQQRDHQGPGAQYIVRTRAAKASQRSGVRVAQRPVCLFTKHLLPVSPAAASPRRRVYPTWPCAITASPWPRPSVSWKTCAGNSQHASAALSLLWRTVRIPFWNLVSLQRNIVPLMSGFYCLNLS